MNEGIELANILEVLGLKLQVVIYTDSSAGRAACRRSGPGERLRHVDIRYWAIQDQVQKKRVVVDKVAGVENPSDLGTKAVSRDVLVKLRPMAGLVPAPGTEKETKKAFAVTAEMIAKMGAFMVMMQQVWKVKAEA